MKENSFKARILDLGLSRLYINQKKLDSIKAWFEPLKIEEYEPLPVYDFFNNGKLHLTDGHTRAFIVYKSGLEYMGIY